VISSQPFLFLYNDVDEFPSFGKVSKEFDVVEKLYSGYSDSTMAHFDLMMPNWAEFLKKFLYWDVIEKAYLVD